MSNEKVDIRCQNMILKNSEEGPKTLQRCNWKLAESVPGEPGRWSASFKKGKLRVRIGLGEIDCPRCGHTQYFPVTASDLKTMEVQDGRPRHSERRNQ